ncbi:hypothetical protein CBF23_002050 [Marinomonas agarivorans]|nr:hypothetical protein CBF23_002050 [Marinomonas agarivorans]
MNKFKTLGLAIAVSAASTALHASDFSYNYIDLGFGITDDENSSSNGEYRTFAGSFVTPMGPFIAFESTSYEEEGQYNVDLTAVGVGAFTATGSQTDIFGTLQLVNADLGTSGDESGFRVSIGARTALGSHVELDGKVKYEDVYEDSDTSIAIALRYYATPGLAASLNYDTAEINGLEIDSMYAAIRFAF